MSQKVSIGDVLFDSDLDEEINVVVTEAKSKRKLTAQAGQGDDDGTLTRGGREPRELKISIDWPRGRPEINAVMQSRIEALDASRPTVKGDKPMPFGYELDGMDVAALKHVNLVEVEETSGPTPDFEKGTMKYEVSLKSASKPKAGTGTTANKDGVAAWKDPNTLTAKVSPGYTPSQTTAKVGGKPAVKP